MSSMQSLRRSKATCKTGACQPAMARFQPRSLSAAARQPLHGVNHTWQLPHIKHRQTCPDLLWTEQAAASKQGLSRCWSLKQPRCQTPR